MSKRKKKKKIPSLEFLDVYQSIRKIWNINPKTRVKPNKKKYNRAKIKRELRKELE